jgi:hydrogenase expression/formation protein HypE
LDVIEPKGRALKARTLDFVRGRIDMSHGGGGRAMAQLVDELFRSAFDNPVLDRGDDQAQLDVGAGRIAFTTDSYVISPLFFPGGDIGSLAVHGTVNDLAMAGAVPKWLSAGFIIEEGFPLADLKRIVDSMAAAARAAGVQVVTGDTKVVERGKGDGVFINTAGIGVVPVGVDIHARRAAPGDRIIVSGTIGDHGVAILSHRQGLAFETDLESDSAALHGLVAAMLAVAPDLHVLRDPTRGGVAATLNEIAQAAGVGIRLDESSLPLRAQVRGACELLGLDPLNVANEGKLLAICTDADAPRVLAAMRAHDRGRDAAIIGVVVEDSNHFVSMDTIFGGRRMIDWLTGEQLPRIC